MKWTSPEVNRLFGSWTQQGEREREREEGGGKGGGRRWGNGGRGEQRVRFIRQIAERGMEEEEWKRKRGRRGREEQGEGQGVEDKVSICELFLFLSRHCSTRSILQPTMSGAMAWCCLKSGQWAASHFTTCQTVR